MLLKTKEVSLSDFMKRFNRHFFETARSMIEYEWSPGQYPHLTRRLDQIGMLRDPFPAQEKNILAAAAHLFTHKKPAIIMSQDMGTGKTLVGSTIAMMGHRPHRTIVVVPPHLVGKWAREIQMTFPNALVHKINHAGANEILAKAFAENPGHPQSPEFWIIGRVRMRMGYRFTAQYNIRSVRMSGWRRRFPTCPSCGRILVTEIKVDKDGNAPSDMTVIGNDDGTQEEGTEQAIYAYMPENMLHAKRLSCSHVADGKGGVTTGCGEPLWQATRHHQKNHEDVLASALAKLPAVGSTTVSKIMALNEQTIREIVSALSNGDIHPEFRNHLKLAALKKVQKFLDGEGFTIGEGNYAPVEFIKRQLRRGWFDVAIFDELHELKGDNSAQGVAFGILASCVSKVIGLTGTLVDGYAASLHPLLFRADPGAMIEAGYGANDASRFQREMGVIKEIVTEVEDDSLVTARGRKKIYRQTRNLSGIHPTVISRLLLRNALFLRLPDIERSIQELGSRHGYDNVKLLPSYRETFIKVKLPEDQQTLVTDFCTSIIKQMKNAMRLGGGKDLMGPVMSAALYCTEGGYHPVVCHPRRWEKPIDTMASLVPDWALLEKEKVMRDLAVRSKAEGRKLLIYTIYSDKLDLTARYRDILRDAGIDAHVLKASVPTELREQWVEDRLANGCDALICNPNLVKTGLDLFEFTDILFMQMGYSVDTVLQASRRSWRIGQYHPVRVYFAGYDKTPQFTAMNLMAKKIKVSNQAKGDISETGLDDLDDSADDSSMMMAVANEFLDGVRDHSHDALTGTISCIEEDVCDGEFRSSGMQVMKDILAKERSLRKPDTKARHCPTPEIVLPVIQKVAQDSDDLLSLLFQQPPVPSAQATTYAKPASPKRAKPRAQPKPAQQFLDLDLFS